MRKAALYYTCNTHDPLIEEACRAQLDIARGGLELGTVSRQPIQFGDWNIVVDQPRSPLTMHRQILAGLRRLSADVVFLCESDVLYHPSHFAAWPEDGDTFLYNTNVWRARWPDGFAVWTDNLEQVSGLCADRKLLLEFYEQRVRQIEAEGFNRHFEPGRKQTVGGRRVARWQSEWPNLDIRHGHTLTRSKWSPGEFRNPQYAAGWREATAVPGWGTTAGQMQRILHDITRSSRRRAGTGN